jgi:hypothetical protein
MLMKDMRIKAAAALMFAVLSTLGMGDAASAATPAPGSTMRYACEPAQNLVVTRSGDTATVQFIDRSYTLRRKASSIGQKYISESAALIIDGKSAVFVAEDRLQLGTCIEAIRLASQ